MFEALSPAERVERAKAVTARVVDHLHYLLELHENNRIIVYSPQLASQIPASYAANAFRVFQAGMHQIEIVRLCALWDKPSSDRESIPTIIELIDSPPVLSLLAEETRGHWANMGWHDLRPSDDPELTVLKNEVMKRHNEEFGDNQARKGQRALEKSIFRTRKVLAAAKLISIRNLRDKHLAHSLTSTRAEKLGPLAPMKYGDERKLLNITCWLVQDLYCWVNGTSLDVSDSREIDRKNAEALWNGCTFKVLR